MNKKNVLDRINSIFNEKYLSGEHGGKLHLCQFDRPHHVDAPKEFMTYLYVNNRGTLSLYDMVFEKGIALSNYTKFILSNILYEIGNQDDMDAVKYLVHPHVYSICLNKLNKKHN